MAFLENGRGRLVRFSDPLHSRSHSPSQVPRPTWEVWEPSSKIPTFMLCPVPARIVALEVRFPDLLFEDISRAEKIASFVLAT